MAEPPSDLNSLNDQLTGVLARVLGGLHDRVATLEEDLAAERTKKALAEQVAEAAMAQLHGMEERLSALMQAQQQLTEAADRMEASFESGLAVALTRIGKTEDKMSESEANEAKVAADEAAKAAEANKETSKINWGKMRSLTSTKMHSLKNFQDAAKEAHKEAAAKRRQGQLFQEWTEMVEGRLKALEEQCVELDHRSREAESSSKPNGYTAAAMMRGEIKKQVALQVEESARASRARLDVQDETLRTAEERSASFESAMQSHFAHVRASASKAAADAKEASLQAQAACAGTAEFAHLRERLAETHGEVVKLYARKCDKEAIDSLRALLSDETDGRLAALESRLTVASDEKLSALTQRADERLEAVRVASEGALESVVSSRLSLIDSRMARKLDAAQEFSRLQQTAADGGTTGKRLRALQEAMGQLLELIVKIDRSPTPSPTPVQQQTATRAPSPTRAHFGVKQLPAAATRPVPLHARPIRGEGSGDAVLAHSGAGVVSTFVGHYATATKPSVEVSRRRPASAGNMRRVETAPVSHPWRANRPGSAKPAPSSSAQPQAIVAPPDSPESRARRLLLDESCSSVPATGEEQEAQWAYTAKQLQLAGV